MAVHYPENMRLRLPRGMPRALALAAGQRARQALLRSLQAEGVSICDGTAAVDGRVSLEDITDNDVLPNAFWEAVMDAIDAKCKVEDAERRTAAKARQAKMTPRSLKRQ